MMRFIRAGFALAFLMVAFSTVSIAQSITKGFASSYPQAMEGVTTASGEAYVSTEFTACHSSLPFNTLVKVTNLRNNKSVTVRINDRFNYRNSRVIDVSKAAAAEIDLFGDITPQVSIEVVGIADALIMASVKTKQNAVTTQTATAVTTPPAATTTTVTSSQAPVNIPAPATTTTATASAGTKKENPSLLSSLKISIPTISVDDVANLATMSINYLSMSFFRK
jgi:rare lipoprotein A